MKAIGLGLAISLVLACTGCNQPLDDATAKKVAAFEAKVGELEKRSSDLEFKGRMVGSHLLGSPLGDFLPAMSSGKIPMMWARPNVPSAASRS